MKRNLQILFIVLLTVSQLQAQQDAKVSHYMFNTARFNPSTAGNAPTPRFTGIYRNQWTGFGASAPKTLDVIGESSTMDNTLGFAGEIINDNLAALNMFGMSGTVNYKYKLNAGEWLASGITLGFRQYTLSGNELTFKDETDDVIPQVQVNKFTPDVRLGFSYVNKNTFAGFSITNLTASKMDFSQQDREIIGKQARHYYVVYEKQFEIDRDFDFAPSFLAKTDDELNVQVDLATLFTYKEFITVGPSLAFGESIALILDWKINENFRLGYAYNMSLGKLASYQNGSNEILLSYYLIPNKKIMTNPRYYFN